MAIAREKMLEIARSLPPGPRVFAALDELLRDTNASLDAIAALIKRDATLTAQLIRVSNSVALGGEQQTGSIEEAIGRIGFVTVHRFVGEMAVARLAERDLTHYGIAADDLREHLLHTAFVCEQLALECGLDARRAYTAGLMRAMGILVLDRVADRYDAGAQFSAPRDIDYGVWEGRLFGLPNADVAAMVLTEWKFPSDIVEAARNQYLLRSGDLDHRLACIVNLAVGASADAGLGLPDEPNEWALSPWKLEALGLDRARFHASAHRAIVAYAEYRGRRGDLPAVAAEAAGASSVAAATAHGVGAGATATESCNFGGAPGVVEANDAPPVHTTEAGVSPATDFTTFMRNYQDMVFSTAARLTGNDAQAEDISQEVFLKAYENYDHLQTSPTAGGWLKTVATNLSLNHLSRYRNRWRFFSEFKRADDADDRDAPEVEFAAPDTFFAGLDAADRRAVVEEALAKLPPHQRVPLVLFHFEDMPYDEIAKKTGVSLAKVKTDILRARTALAKILTRGASAQEKVQL